MGSTSAARAGDFSSRLRNKAAELSSDPLIADIRKTITAMKEIAVEMEKSNRTNEVKTLEDAVTQLVNATEECVCFSSVMESVRTNYQPLPGQQFTDFKKLFEDEAAKFRANSSSNPSNSNLLRQFNEAVWQVHHAGQPMPGDEEEDIVMTSTEVGLLNTACPISGKPITLLDEPVRSLDCKHIYEKSAIMQHLRRNKAIKCPVAGCPKKLEANRIICDALLPVEIDELRSQNKETDRGGDIEDFTALDDED